MADSHTGEELSAQFRDASRFWIQRVFVPLVVGIGVLGNVVTIVVLTRRRMRSSTNVYLTALAVSDLMYLLFVFTLSFKHYPNIREPSFLLYWQYYGFGIWFTDATTYTSIWLTVSFTVERYIAVCHPMRGRLICTESRAKKVIVLVYVFCFVTTVTTPLEYEATVTQDPKDNSTLVSCVNYTKMAINETYRTVFYWFTTITFVFVPLILLGIFNSFLIHAVRKSQQQRCRMTQDLTGIEDISVCRDVLQRHAWDLEVSVQDQLNMREGRPSVFVSDVRTPAVVNDHSAQRMFFPTSRDSNPHSIRGLFKYVVSLVLQLCYNTITSILQLTFRLFQPDPRRYVTDPVADVLAFIRLYEQNYGYDHPVFYQGTYSQALNDAKQELRFLLVYLHCEEHQDTTKFCRYTLPHPEVISYINSNMLFWACSVTTSEGYRVSQALRENGYPFLAVIVLHDGRMTVVGRLEGPVEPDELIARLQTIVADNEVALIAARAERVELNFNQTLRQQQDQAYLESLRADQEKERRRCEERERREGEARQRRERELEEQYHREEIQRQKIEYQKHIPDEPPSDHPEAVHIVIKLPNGMRLERRFLQSESLEAVFYYVFCHPASPDTFEIATNFPKRVLNCAPQEGNHIQTLKEAGLRCREVLFVYDLEA